MRSLAFLILSLTLSLSAFAQGEKNNFDKTEKQESSAKLEIGEEQEEFDKATNHVDPAERVSALQDFIKNFPESEKKERVLGLIASGRAQLADVKLTNNEPEEAIRLFKLAVKEAPTPFANKFYSGVILQIPNNLYFRGQRKAASEVAKLIEEKVASNPDQTLAIAPFYLGTENASGAIRLATRAIELDPASKGAYQTLGLAYRFNFDLEKSTEAYAKAVENNEESTVAKLSLAEMKRATSKPSEAIAIYQAILTNDPLNVKANTGLILSLFDLGKVSEAETEMEKSLANRPDNLFLLVGSAYWYAANGNGEKAINLSQKALGVEPRYSWAYIALAKGLMKTGDPLGAERALLTARKFGNFPTLEYEIASARLAAGFYKDAAEDLRANFTLENGVIKTKLGRRIEKEARSFTELLSLERRSSIFQPASGDNANAAEKLKSLLAFADTLDAKEEVKEEDLIKSADEFVAGDDKMKTHRQLFIANQLLRKKKALSKVIELAKDAGKGIDAAIEVDSASSAVLADELYETRKIAILRGEALIVPDIPKQTLTNIIRGKIEEITGWALFEQSKNDEALVRMKRAASVMPNDSVWMRSTMWKTGKILDSQGELEKALDHYIKGFSIDERSEEKTITIESLYKKLNGSLDGLKERLAAKPVDNSNTASIFTKDGVTGVDTNQENEKQNEQPKENNNVETEPKKDRIPDIVPIANENDKNDPTVIPTKPVPKEDSESENLQKQAAKEVNLEIEILELEIPTISNMDDLETTNDGVEAKKNETAKKIGNRSETKAKSASPDIVDKKVKSTEEIVLDDTQKAIDEEYDRLIAEMEGGTSEDKSDQAKSTELDKPDAVKVSKEDKSAEGKSTDTAEKDSKDSEVNEATELDKNPIDLAKPVLIVESGLPKNAAGDEDNRVEKNADDKTNLEVETDSTNKVDESSNKVEAKKDEKDTDLNAKDRNVGDKTDELLVKTPAILKETLDNGESSKTVKTETVEENIVDIISQIDFDSTRPRFVVEEIKITECEIFISQDVVSIINNGGSLGVLVGVDKDSVNSDIKATSSSPKDVEVIFEPEIGAVQKRAYFLIRSVTTIQGDFTVKFDTPCGEKEIVVKVR